MTAASTADRSDDVGGLGDGEPIDLLIESGVLPHDPRTRAAVIWNRPSEVRAAVRRLHGSESMLDDPQAERWRIPARWSPPATPKA